MQYLILKIPQNIVFIAQINIIVYNACIAATYCILVQLKRFGLIN